MKDVYQQIVAHLYAVWQRRWQAVITAWAVCFVGWVVVYMVPDKYESFARIYVNTDTVLRPLMRNLAVDTEGDVVDKLATIQQTMLSRPNLEKVLRMTDMDLSATSGSSTQKKVNELAQNVKLELQDGVNIFRVSYQNSDPAVAKRVVQSLLTIFVESNLGVNRKELAGARRFIDNQLKEYERQLQEAEKRRADFQRNNIGYLPGDQNYLQQLETAKTNLRQSESDLKDAKVQLSEMKKYMSGLSPRLEVTNPSAYGPPIGGGIATSTINTTIAARIATLRANIDDLKARFTANHPDVVVAQRQLDELLAQVKAQQSGVSATNGQGDNSDLAANATVSNPVYEQVMVKVIDQESKVAVLQGRVLDQRQQVAKLDEEAKTVPEVEAKMARMDRDYNVLKANYDSLLSTRESAKIATDMETNSDNVQFRVIDPPTTSLRPVTPNRPLLLSGVLLLGVVTGIAVAFLLSQIHSTYLTVQRLREEFALPVVGSISAVLLPEARRQRVTEAVTFAACFGGLLIAYGGVMLLDSLFMSAGA
jgi:polysaccharide chain length determinant protein (PEP-CTERM system associated)